MIFGVVKSGEMLDFSVLCRSGYRTRKWGFRCGNIRYAVPGFRLSVLKCKPRPHHGIKSYYNSTVLWYILWCQVKMLYTCNDPVCYPVKVKYLTRFGVRLRCYRKLSTTYPHSYPQFIQYQ